KDDGRGGVHHGHRLAALSAVAAVISSPPSAGGVEGFTAVAGGVGHRADHRDGDITTEHVHGRGWCIEGPWGAELDGLVGAAAAIHRRWRSIDEIDRLAAAAEIA